VEDLIPDWPDTGEEESGIFFTPHEVDFTLSHPDAIAHWIEEAIENEGFSLARIDFVFCSDAFLLDINIRHLGHDFYTDIITFPLNEDPLLAEIYISIDRVQENAAKLKVTFDEELHRVMIHGVLHLCGYDDHEEEDVRIMRKKEEAYLRLRNEG
jgi:rRNA maturation RNase YbeY